MTDRGEMVVIEMAAGDRLRLYGEITSQMKKLGHNPCNYAALNLGFDLPADWPMDMNDRPTMARLIVLAQKLKMRIVINNMNLEPLKPSDDDGENGQL